MKKIFLSLILVFTLFIGNVSAINQNPEEAKLYKAIILSKAKIEKDFFNWSVANKAIEDFFKKLRVSPDYKKIDDLEKRITKAMNLYQWKTYDKNYNLVSNIYYRVKLLKDYQLKDSFNSSLKNLNNSILNNSNSIINSSNSNNSSSKNDDIIRWINQKVEKTDDNIIRGENQKIKTDDNKISNIISNNNKLPNISSNNVVKNNVEKSLSFSYLIPSWWKEYNKNEETILVDENFSTNQNSMSFLITDYTNYNSFESFRDSYRDELSKRFYVQDEKNYQNIDWKTTYALKYYENGADKVVFLSEYNGMILITNMAVRNSSVWSKKDLNDILNSIKIKK